MIRQYINKKDFIKFDLEDLIEPKQIINSSFIQSFIGEHLDISLQELKLNTIENQMQLENSKSKQIIEYVQTKYGGRRSFLFDENFSLGIGINLPFFGNARQKKGNYYFDKLNAEHKYKMLKKKKEYNELIKKNEFENVKLNYQTLIKQTKESSISALLETYKKMEGISPLLLLKLEILVLKKEIEISKSQHQLYKTYVKLLATNGVLFQKPFRDYLSNNF